MIVIFIFVVGFIAGGAVVLTLVFCLIHAPIDESHDP